MKKLIGCLLSAVILAVLLVPSTVVQAASVKTMEASGTNGVLTVSGTTSEDSLAVAILVYDEAGTSLVYIETVGVSDAHTYSSSISLKNGTYVVKAGDYDGSSDLISKTVTITESTVTSNPTTTAVTTETKTSVAPKTEDSQLLYLWVLIMTISGMGMIYIKKQKG